MIFAHVPKHHNSSTMHHQNVRPIYVYRVDGYCPYLEHTGVFKRQKSVYSKPVYAWHAKSRGQNETSLYTKPASQPASQPACSSTQSCGAHHHRSSCQNSALFADGRVCFARAHDMYVAAQCCKSKKRKEKENEKKKKRKKATPPPHQNDDTSPLLRTDDLKHNTHKKKNTVRCAHPPRNAERFPSRPHAFC